MLEGEHEECAVAQDRTGKGAQRSVVLASRFRSSGAFAQKGSRRSRVAPVVVPGGSFDGVRAAAQRQIDGRSGRVARLRIESVRLHFVFGNGIRWWRE